MAYIDHFKHADDLILHLNTVVPMISDPLLKSKYVGFVSIAAVTVFELAIKDIFFEFGNKTHKVLGTFTAAYFNRINGRIRIKEIENSYTIRFGINYQTCFKNDLSTFSQSYLQKNKRDIKSSYENLIIWRNKFAHEGILNTTATYQDVVQSYNDGKEVIHCLARSMI